MEKQPAQILQVIFRGTGVDASSALSDQKDASHLVPEEVRRKDAFQLAPIDSGVGVNYSGTIAQAPGDGDGGIDHNSHSRRPSSRH